MRCLASIGKRGSATDTRALGRKGERIAVRFLRRHKYRILDRNHFTSAGEADIVCLAPDRTTLVIVEVKSRLYTEAQVEFTPETAVGAAKRRTLARVAQLVALERNRANQPVRIDVIAIELRPAGKPIIRHHERAVIADGRIG